MGISYHFLSVRLYILKIFNLWTFNRMERNVIDWVFVKRSVLCAFHGRVEVSGALILNFWILKSGGKYYF